MIAFPSAISVCVQIVPGWRFPTSDIFNKMTSAEDRLLFVLRRGMQTYEFGTDQATAFVADPQNPQRQHAFVLTQSEYQEYQRLLRLPVLTPDQFTGARSIVTALILKLLRRDKGAVQDALQYVARCINTCPTTIDRFRLLQCVKRRAYLEMDGPSVSYFEVTLMTYFRIKKEHLFHKKASELS